MAESREPCCACGGFRLTVQPEGRGVTIRAEREDAAASDASPCVIVCHRESASGDAAAKSPRQIVIRCGPTGPEPDKPTESDPRTCC